MDSLAGNARRWRKLAVGGVLAALLLSACGGDGGEKSEDVGTASQVPNPAHPPTPAGTASAPPGMKLAWSDEFDGPAVRLPDAGKWGFDVLGTPDSESREWQQYKDRPENVGTDGRGNLAITARKEQLPGMKDKKECKQGPCDITSGRISSKGLASWQYGRFEARIQVPPGKGVWPGFWMLGDDIDRVDWPASGEIDIVEVVGDAGNTAWGTIHGPGYPPGGIQGQAATAAGKFSDGFHTYRVDWEPERLTWFIDDVQFFTVTKGQIGDKLWVYDKPFHLLLNLAVGGEWPGYPDASTPFPAAMLVDYVRVFQKTG